MPRRAAFLFTATALFTASCHGGSDGGAHDLAHVGPPPFCSDAPDANPPPTFASVKQILAIHCAVPGCHDAGPTAADVMQDLRPDHAYASIVNVPAHETCGGLRVVPGHPEKSYLYHKLTDETPCKGNQMPQSEVGAFPLPPCEIAIIKQWIQSGALP